MGMIVTSENIDPDAPVFDGMGPVPVWTEPGAKSLTAAARKRITREQDKIFAAVMAKLEAERAERDATPLLSVTEAFRIVAGFSSPQAHKHDAPRQRVVCPVCGEVFNPQVSAGDVALVRHEDSGGHTIGYTKEPCPHANVLARWGALHGICSNCGAQVARDEPEQGEGDRDVIDTRDHGKLFAQDGDLEAVAARFRKCPGTPHRGHMRSSRECPLERKGAAIREYEGEPMPDVVAGLQIWKESTITTPDNRGASLLLTVPAQRDNGHRPTERLDLVRRIAAEQRERNTAEIPKVEA